MQVQLVRTLSERTRLAKRDRSSVMISQWAKIVHLRRILDVRRLRLLCGPKTASLSVQFHLFNHLVVTKASSRCRLSIERAKKSTLLNLQRISTSPSLQKQRHLSCCIKHSNLGSMKIHSSVVKMNFQRRLNALLASFSLKSVIAVMWSTMGAMSQIAATKGHLYKLRGSQTCRSHQHASIESWLKTISRRSLRQVGNQATAPNEPDRSIAVVPLPRIHSHLSCLMYFSLMPRKS